MPYTRCSKCEGRHTLARKPEAYIRLPKCKHCGRTMTLDGKPPPGSRIPARRVARYRIDKYRHRFERGRGAAARTCVPGRGGCSEYHFPHRRGSGYCLHNPTMTPEKAKEREQ